MKLSPKEKPEDLRVRKIERRVVVTTYVLLHLSQPPSRSNLLVYSRRFLALLGFVANPQEWI